MQDYKSHIQLVNNTNYFIRDKSRVVNTFLSPKTYAFKKSKQEGIEVRLYYEFKECQKLDGQTFFYTLTYNDKSLPHFEGVPCFDYNDIITFLNGGFKKYLLRHYGTNFRYFVGAEFGEGAGSRGLSNNPHYHILLFLRPDKVSGVPYTKISVSSMRHLVKMYWQGFDESESGYRDYRTCKYGIAKPSDKGDLVLDYKACTYCAKYVTKDVHFYKSESIIKNRLFDKYYPIVYNSKDVQNSFFEDYILSRYSLMPDDLPSKADYYWSNVDCIKYIAPELSFLVGDYALKKGYIEFFNYILSESGLHPDYQKYVQNIVNIKVKEGVNLWRNRYSNKYRISNGLGEYALDFIDERQMRIPFPSSSGGFKNRPVPLFYFRKVCCDVIKDMNGNNKYILNQKGIEYSTRYLNRRLEKIESTTSVYFNQFDYDLYHQFISMYKSSLTFEDIVKKVNEYPDIFKKYAEYKFIYEYRYFPYRQKFPPLIPSLDYENFLQTSINDSDFCPNGAIEFLKDNCEGYLPYSQHIYFIRYIYLFKLFDFLNDYFFLIKDLKDLRQNEDFNCLRKFHKKFDLDTYFNKFKNGN